MTNNLTAPSVSEKCSCGAWICKGCLCCSSDCGCAKPNIPCGCWFKDQTVCDICQGTGGTDSPLYEEVRRWWPGKLGDSCVTMCLADDGEFVSYGAYKSLKAELERQLAEQKGE